MTDESMRDGRAMAFDKGGKDKMSIPERIVLSAGYDGDDNEETPGTFHNNVFDETPMVNPSDMLGGMQTPPSVLTIDHSSNIFRNSPNWHTEGDGADDDDNQNSHSRYTQRLDDENDDDFTHATQRTERSVVIAGQEDYLNHHIPYDDPRAMQQWYASMQRRLTILENEQEHQNRISNVWKYFLLTLSIVNPILINYFFFNRRR